MDQWTIFTGSEPLEGGAIRYTLNRNSDIFISKTIAKTYEGLYALSRTDLTKTYQIDTSLLRALTSFSSDIILRPSYDSLIPATSVIDALVWSYAEILDAVWRQMDTMSTALKLEHAQGTDLDDAWGQIFDLPRLKTEDDTQYRDRLKTRTIILNCSGTNANCKSIIDSIIGESATTVETQYPATVNITFDTDTALRTAKSKLTTLNLLVPQMLAIGTDYNIFLPFADYTADIVMNGPIWLAFNMYYGLKRRNTDAAYESDLINVFHNVATLSDVDTIISKLLYKTFLMGSLFEDTFTESYTMSNGNFKTVNKNIPFDLANKKFNNLVSFFVDGYCQKSDLEKSLLIDIIDKATKRRMYRTEITAVLQTAISYDFDVISRLLLAPLDMDILSKRGFPKRCAMRLTLVGA